MYLLSESELQDGWWLAFCMFVWTIVWDVVKMMESWWYDRIFYEKAWQWGCVFCCLGTVNVYSRSSRVNLFDGNEPHGSYILMKKKKVYQTNTNIRSLISISVMHWVSAGYCVNVVMPVPTMAVVASIPRYCLQITKLTVLTPADAQY